MSEDHNGQKYEWTPKQLKAIEALSDPMDSRTQEQIAQDIKVCAETVSRWKRLPGFMNEVSRRLDEKRRFVRPGVWKASYHHAVRRSVHDRRLLMEAVGDIKSKTEHDGEVTVKIEWGPEKPQGVKEGQQEDDES